MRDAVARTDIQAILQVRPQWVRDRATSGVLVLIGSDNHGMEFYTRESVTALIEQVRSGHVGHVERTGRVE